MTTNERIERQIEEFKKEFCYQESLGCDTDKTLFTCSAEKEDGSDLIDFLRTSMQLVREDTLEEFFRVEKEKWNDAEHCTCLGYALVQVAGGEDSEGGKKMEERLNRISKGEETV